MPIAKLDEETRKQLPSVKERFRTDVPHLRAGYNTGLDGVELSWDAKRMLCWLQDGITKEDFLDDTQEMGIDGEAVWEEIMSHQPNLDTFKSGMIRFKREVWIYGVPKFKPEEKLTLAAQELYKEISIGNHKEPELRELARERGIDFEATVAELKSHGGLYDVDPAGFVGWELRIVEE